LAQVAPAWQTIVQLPVVQVGAQELAQTQVEPVIPIAVQAGPLPPSVLAGPLSAVLLGPVSGDPPGPVSAMASASVARPPSGWDPVSSLLLELQAKAKVESAIHESIETGEFIQVLLAP
jgi:hypothetical protein